MVQLFTFIGEFAMKELKEPYSFEQQLNKLIEHGMICEDTDAVLDFLKKKNYYRITGYALQQRVSAHDSNYSDGTTFDNIYKIYLFDQAIRNILRKYIEIAEIYYRTQISYGFAMQKCTAPPHDQHYDENNFYKKDGYKGVMDNFQREKKHYEDSLIMKHHKSKYNSRLPLWAMVEMMSFSDLSKLYSSMYISEQDYISTAVGTGSKMLKNNLHCLSVLRNKCAHGARLYNTRLNPAARFNSSFLRSNPDFKSDTLFAYILVLLKRLPDSDCKRSFVTEIMAAIEQYKEDIDFTLIGMPSNYEELLEKNT